MAAALKSALPSHLKPSSLGAGDANAEFARKHHGKTQSHMGKYGLPNSSIILVFGQQVVTSNSLNLVEGRKEGTIHGVHHVMGEDCLCIYLPGNLVHWDRPGKNLLHLESKALPRSLGFTSAIPSEPPLTQHPAFCPSLTMAASNLSTGTSAPSLNHTEYDVPTPLPIPEHPTLREIAKLIDHDQAFENTSTSVAASQMRNALNNLADTVEDPTEKKLFETEMDNFFALFRRYLNDKAKGNQLDWDRIAPPATNQVVDYNELANSESVSFLSKLAVLKLNGGLGTSMGCVGPKSVIEVRDGMSFLDLSVRQIEYLNRTYDVNVPFVLMNSFNTDDDTQNIIKKYEGHNIDIMTFNQSRYPRILKDSLLPAPKSFNSPISDWYPPGHGDVFESLYNSGILEKLIDRGVEILFLSNVDNLGAVVDLRILQHMVETKAEYIMELTDKTKADVKGGTIIDYEGSVRLLEIAQVPKEHTNEFKSIKKFKYFNTNNIWLNLKAVKRIVENNELEMEIIPNNKTIPADKKGESDVSIVQLETAVGAAIRHFHNAHGVNVPRRRFLPVKTCSDLMLVKSDLYSLKHGQLQIDPNRFGPAPLIKLGNDFKKVSDFQKRIGSIPKIIELDHLTITGAVNLGRGVTLKGTVIIVATEGSTIDIPPGSILENVVVQGSLRLLEH
ncbi:putative UTP--glucose-1-phosphate uridylyltransferase [Lachnellula cervina]|uniref:UTP--glucose-1-phosphate uridylyltransferase n=1 Tax=Lachnellula cervina TaxID=1316786 RepID=A0A7D8YXM3_9HELO|nr:putative UTP--glucose-1-phosphate uridylyltransferase [Lachnellula cervina]